MARASVQKEGGGGAQGPFFNKVVHKGKNLLQEVSTFSVGFDVALMYGTRKTFVHHVALLTSASQRAGLCSDYEARQLFRDSTRRGTVSNAH